MHIRGYTAPVGTTEKAQPQLQALGQQGMLPQPLPVAHMALLHLLRGEQQVEQPLPLHLILTLLQVVEPQNLGG